MLNKYCLLSRQSWSIFNLHTVVYEERTPQEIKSLDTQRHLIRRIVSLQSAIMELNNVHKKENREIASDELDLMLTFVKPAWF